MEQRDPSVELLLNFRSAGSRKGHCPQILRCAVIVRLLCLQKWRKNEQQGEEHLWYMAHPVSTVDRHSHDVQILL